MDGLLAEISSKRKALAELDGAGAGAAGGSEAGPSRKYMRRSEVEAAREAGERRQREEAKRAREEESARKKGGGRAESMRKEAEQARSSSLSRLASSPAPSSGRGTPEPTASSTSAPSREAFNISPEECIRRLRAKGQPIRLFGETDKDRRLRLRALELLEEKGDGLSFNDYRRTMAEMDRAREEREAREGPSGKVDAGKGGAAGAGKEEGAGAGAGGEVGAGGKGGAEKRVEVGLIDLGLIKSDPGKLNPLIYYALKNILKEWEEWMDARPEDVKRSGQGKLAAATQVQSAQNLKPLFRQLRNRDLPSDVVRHLAEIVHFIHLRSYQKANDAYLRMSIGNAAWPIGVTSVGLHERNARERISEDVIAHVLNDEVSRKYIQAVKRLLTFSQMVRPPDDRAHAMG